MRSVRYRTDATFEGDSTYLCCMTIFPERPATGSDENRHIFCQMSVERPLQDLVESALQQGWSDVEVLSAIIEVADNLVLATGANSELQQLLSGLRKPT